MSDTKFTPGPWRIVHYPQEPIYVGPCQLVGSEHRPATATDHADARLIAAAPDLYAAIRQIEAILSQPVQRSLNDSAATCEVLRGDALTAMNVAREAMRRVHGA